MKIIIAIIFLTAVLIQLAINETRFDNFFEQRDKQIRDSIRPVNKGVQVDWDKFLKIWNNEE